MSLYQSILSDLPTKSKLTLPKYIHQLSHENSFLFFRAFHVFKVFVANPKKPTEISDILFKNKAKLIPFLESFQTEKGDEQFNDEKSLLVE